MYINAVMILCMVFITFCLLSHLQDPVEDFSRASEGALSGSNKETFYCKNPNLTNSKQNFSWKGLCSLEEN